MYRELCLAFALGILCVLVQNTHGLQCWNCKSEYDVTCRDYFNKTKIEQNRRYFDSENYGNRQIQPVRNDPHLFLCDEMYTSSYNHKNVCLKRVYKGAHGIPVVNRRCYLVPMNLKSGECPEDLHDSSKEIEFCGTCEEDGCNGATSLKLNVFSAAVIPASIALLLRK